LTNPSGLVEIESGVFIMAVREQKKMKFKAPDEPWPGRSQVGLYEVRMKPGFEQNPSSENLSKAFSIKRTTTLFSDKEDWFEDPAIAIINGKLIIGVVKVASPKIDQSKQPGEGWWTEFYELKLNSNRLSDPSLKPLFPGPFSMKDIRLFEFTDAETQRRKIGILTRPKGDVYTTKNGNRKNLAVGDGYIGLEVVDALSEITPELIKNAPPLLTPKRLGELNPLFHSYNKHFEGLWLGANSVVVEPNGTWTVYGHTGTKGPYSMMSFSVLPPNRYGEAYRVTKASFLAGVRNFGNVPDGDVRPNTTFTGGVRRLTPQKDLLTAGLNDYKLGFILVDTPNCKTLF
jgi:hypothetical protein